MHMCVAKLSVRRMFCFAVIALFLSGIAAAQTPSAAEPPQAPSAQEQQKSKSWSEKLHFNPLAAYTPQHLAPPSFANTTRIDDLLQNGKLMLSIDDAIALALENNLDIAIQRNNMRIADTDLMRAQAGASILGVNFGVVQGTPGGGVGGIGSQVGSGPGGTAVAAGGAGAGIGGIVGSTLGLGPQITSFDPVLTGTIQFDRAKFIPTSPFSGTAQNTTTANFSYVQGFHSGTNLAVGFNNSRVTSNNVFTLLSPSISSGFTFRLTQHLLQGFGLVPNDRFIRIAKNDREISDVAFRLQVTATVGQIENMYWDLVYAYENARVAREALAFAQKTLADTKRQVEVGALAHLDIVRAQSTVASDQQALTVANTNLQLQQLLMKNAISRNLLDNRLADAEVIPTSTVSAPKTEPVVPTEDLVNEALTHRPELVEARMNLTNSSISNKAIRNSLLPSLDMFAYYGGNGTGGSPNPASICGNPGSIAAFCRPAGSIPSTGYGETLGDLVDSSAPDKGIGFTLNIPIRNRAARATQMRSELEYSQAQMRLQQIENQVRIEVRNAQFAVQQNHDSVAAAQAAVDLARESLSAEQEKFDLGSSTPTVVLQYQTQLAESERTLMSAMAAYEKASTELDRATGRLLERAGIQIAEAEKGQVTQMPHVPYAQPRPAQPPTTPAPAPQP